VTISRRDLLRTGLVAGGVGALGSAGVLAPAPVWAAPRAAGTTLEATLLRGKAGRGGYVPVVRRAGEPHLVRTDLGVPAGKKRSSRRKGLLAFAQLTDVHVVDAQSPLRVEWLDRYEDQASAGDPAPGLFSAAYRPHETLTAQVADAMVRAIKKVGAGPVTGLPLSFALQTGDNSDNSQRNEVRWNIDLLDGLRIRPDSGDLTRYEGVMDNDPTYYDTHYWHPDGPPTGAQDDDAHSDWGFPRIPGLLDASRRPFDTGGLGIPWLTAFGNHDGLVQGNFPHTLPLSTVATGSLKLISPPAGVSQADLLRALQGDYAAFLQGLAATPYVRAVTADAGRRILTRAEIVEEHFHTKGTPTGHGFTAANRANGTAYYKFDKGLVRFIVLDTVNPNGEADGSLDQAQFDWLGTTLAASKNRIVIITSHHTIDTLTNPLVGTGGDTQQRVLGDQVEALLLQHPQVVAWVNGHTHRNQIWAHKQADGKGGFWEVNTASHVDFPQQSRLVEVADNRDGTLSIFTTIVDHDGPAAYGGRLGDPTHLAGLARELAANDWQERTTGRRGVAEARNVELLVEAPAFLASA
jgi:metallophosphoesterase (TIGR03767 family)